MAWDEWEHLKAQAAEKQSAGMQLNQLPADPGRGGGAGAGDLVVNQDDLGAVGHEAFILHDHLSKQADIAGAGVNKDGAGSTMQAAASLKSHGFAMGSAMETTVEVWTTQVKSVLQACAHISNHLNFSKKLHSQDDALIAADLRNRDGTAESVSRLNDYFK
ncbi:hypothetical protein CLM62_16775 [Streptomyces sp. SA15]|uniref:hypothetical protein n=1 Tax=Streptomyces sp. SA15 TaxID=934019 RepID=UPI000BAEB930|nr:hypothetical protein [Streptomyces sp. SA15]PAZ14890.1 hypothetical protein CLM62_16775 [Streptomyces sp. SA15]